MTPLNGKHKTHYSILSRNNMARVFFNLQNFCKILIKCSVCLVFSFISELKNNITEIGNNFLYVICIYRVFIK